VTTFAAIVMDAISYAGWLFLTSVGLTLVFGVLRLLNIAHGGFYAVGAYAAAYAIGLCVSNGLGVAWQFLCAGALALTVGAILGLAVERGVLGRLYRHPQALILIATYAVFLMLDDATKLIFGGQSLYANRPRDALGQIEIGVLQYPVYDVALIAVAVAVAGAISIVLHRTRIGHCVTAVVFDREVAAAMGINVAGIMTGTFVIGAALGALAGALTAPKIAITPGIGVEVIVLAFAVIVIGGLGSISGALVGALVVGLAHAATAHLFPEIELFAVYAAMTSVLAFRPYGLFARPEARQI
jgi:branched-chain amino acid transport system permease protein